jgi:hypothetical protein
MVTHIEEITMLITEPNLQAPDDFYEELIEAHRGFDTAQSHELNAKLVLFLANQVGDQAVLIAILQAARESTLKRLRSTERGSHEF